MNRSMNVAKVLKNFQDMLEQEKQLFELAEKAGDWCTEQCRRESLVQENHDRRLDESRLHFDRQLEDATQ
jgi:hypothetical protein